MGVTRADRCLISQDEHLALRARWAVNPFGMESMTRRIFLSIFPVLGIGLTLGLTLAGERQVRSSDPHKVAQQVDMLLAEELATRSTAPARVADDTVFMRRVYLDLIGKPPSPEEVLAFAADASSDKKERLVEKLLADPNFGRNWAAYWRDVILYRRTEERALLVANPLMEFLTETFNQNTPWNEIATQFLTAKGDIQTNGATALIMAQGGKPEEIVAEVSRIFLGIQIQCAQCHDHPSERWKREQFHQLAAFFPRVAVRPDRSGDRPTFLVTVNDKRSFREGSKPIDLSGRRNISCLI